MKTFAAAIVSVVAVSSVIAVAACSGGSSGVGPGGVATTEASYCDARSERSLRCAADTGVAVTNDREGCSRDYRCYVALLANPDGYFSCRTKPDCSGASNDRCIVESGAGVSRPEADVCAKKYASCKSAGGKSFDDETCPALSVLRDDVLSRVMPCFDKPCNEVGDCVEATINAAAPSCD